jgi:hypothetical protein
VLLSLFGASSAIIESLGFLTLKLWLIVDLAVKGCFVVAFLVYFFWARKYLRGIKLRLYERIYLGTMEVWRLSWTSVLMTAVQSLETSNLLQGGVQFLTKFLIIWYWIKIGIYFLSVILAISTEIYDQHQLHKIVYNKKKNIVLR